MKNLTVSDVYGQEIKCIPETAIRFIFQAFLLKIGLIRLWMGNFLLEEEISIQAFQLFQRISR